MQTLVQMGKLITRAGEGDLNWQCTGYTTWQRRKWIYKNGGRNAFIGNLEGFVDVVMVVDMAPFNTSHNHNFC